jgi:hypothetical protein
MSIMTYVGSYWTSHVGLTYVIVPIKEASSPVRLFFLARALQVELTSVAHQQTGIAKSVLNIDLKRLGCGPEFNRFVNVCLATICLIRIDTR